MILVFAGAGASKAVGPEKYPTTVEFFQRLPETVTGNKLFQFAVAYLREDHGAEETIDIEQVLWVTHELREFVSKAADSSTVPGWFLKNNRLSQIVDHGREVHTTQGVATQAITAIDSLLSSINTHVYDLYRDPPNEADLAANWVPLLKGLIGTGHRFEVVTTNYDIVLEQVIKLIDALRAPNQTAWLY